MAQVEAAVGGRWKGEFYGRMERKGSGAGVEQGAVDEVGVCRKQGTGQGGLSGLAAWGVLLPLVVSQAAQFDAAHTR